MPRETAGADGIGEAAVGALVLEVTSLTTVFDLKHGTATAVDSVSLHIREGETLGLVGESGSGKSVTALSLMRLVQPPGRIASGRISFKGRDLLAFTETEMQRIRGAGISLIFQEPMTALNPVYTVGYQIAEALLVHGRATRATGRAEAIRLLTAVRIPDAAARVDDYPHQLSGGMRQRAMIAIAIACKPALVIADEPTTALDVTLQAEILDLLREMKRTLNLSLLLVTHDLGVIAETADRVAVMYAGRIVEQATVREIFRAPQHPYTQALLASMPGGARGSRLKAIEGAVPRLGALPSGCAFHPRCPNRMERCSVEVPGDYTIAPGHSAKCFLLDSDLRSQSSSPKQQAPTSNL